MSERLLSAASMPEPSSPSAWAERDVALVATLGLTGLGVSELVSLSLGSLRRDSSGGFVLVTGAAGQNRVVALQPGLADLLDAYLASRKAWLGSESPDAVLFIDASAQPMTSSKVQFPHPAPLRAQRPREPSPRGSRGAGPARNLRRRGPGQLG